MSRYRVILALAATGQIRRPENPTEFAFVGGGDGWRTTETEEEALRFKDEILSKFKDLEVIVHDEDRKGPVRRFVYDGDTVICEITGPPR